MRMTKATAAAALGVMLVATLSGCTIKVSSLQPNTHFAYPSGNVAPLGQVSAETSRTRVFSAATVDQEMMDEVITKALKEKGGDLLINAKISTSVTMYPLIVLPISIFTTTLRVDATAAKQTVGKQELK